MDIRTFVILTGNLAGFHAKTKQPLPGTAKLWQGLKTLFAATFTHEAMQKWDGDY